MIELWLNLEQIDYRPKPGRFVRLAQYRLFWQTDRDGPIWQTWKGEYV